MATEMDNKKYENLKETCIKELQSYLDYVEHYSVTKQADIKDLLDVAQEYCNVDIQFIKADRASKQTEDYFNDEENDSTVDVRKVYDDFLTKLPSEPYQDHPIWKTVNGAIEGKTYEPDVESDEDIVETETTFEEGIVPSQFEPPVDPITKQIISDPCRNKKCGHVYEYSTVMNHLNNIKNNKSKSMCPYIGCTNKLMSGAFIIKDKALKEQIRGYVANRSVPSEDEDEDSQDIL